MDRAAIIIDLENLVFAERMTGDWDGALELISGLLGDVRRRALPVMCVAVCDQGLARNLAMPLAQMGVRVHVHRGGPDAADICLIERMHADIPASCSLVVIASGDHAFAESAQELRSKGKKVEAIASRRKVSAALYVSVDDFADLAELSSEIDLRHSDRICA